MKTATKKWKILIHSMTFARDFGMTYLLSRLLTRLGCECVVANNSNLTALPMRLWNPDAVFFVTPGRADKLAEIYPDAKLFLFSAEGSVNYSRNETDIAQDSKMLGMFTRIYLWGEVPRKYVLEKYMLTPNAAAELFDSKFKVAGNPRGDIIKYGIPKQKTGKIKIGFVGNFWILNTIKKNFSIFSYLFDKYSNTRTWEDIIYQIRYLQVFTEIIEQLDLGRYEISLRPYPLERKDIYYDIEYVKNRGIEIDESVDFSSWIKKQDIIIGNGISTTISILTVEKIPFINLTKVCGSSLEIYEKVMPPQLMSVMTKNSPSTVQETLEKIRTYDQHVYYSDESVDLLDELYSTKSVNSSILRTAIDVVSVMNKCGTGPGKSKLPFEIIKMLDRLDMKYKYFRNRNTMDNDYSFFQYADVLAKAQREFDPVYDNIINDPENQKLLTGLE